MKHFLILLFCIIFYCYNLSAQAPIWPKKDLKTKSIKKEKTHIKEKLHHLRLKIKKSAMDRIFKYSLSCGVRLNTNGWSGGFYFLNNKSPSGSQILWELLFSEIKDKKETKRTNKSVGVKKFGKGRPYIFGKINNIYTIDLGYGRQLLALPALINGNLSLILRLAIGPSLAILKPYHLQMIHVRHLPQKTITLKAETYNNNNAPHFLNPSFIHGAGNWSKGLGQSKFIPGLFGDFSIVLSPFQPKAFIKSIFIGGKAAVYTKPLDIMADKRGTFYQTSLFVGIALGGRW